MRTLLRFAAPLAALTACRAPGAGPRGPIGPEWQHHVSLGAGFRRLESGTFDGIDEPFLYGIEWDVRRPDWLVGFEAGVNRSEDTERLSPSGRFHAEIHQLYVGLRATFDLTPRLQPYLALGLNEYYTEVEFEAPGFPFDRDTDWDSGYYLKAGLRFRVDDHLTIGLDVRHDREEDLDYGGFELDAQQATLRLGWSF